LINFYSFHSSIRLIKRRFLHESYLGVVVVTEEQAGVYGGGGAGGWLASMAAVV
jgi:hypothetical protein